MTNKHLKYVHTDFNHCRAFSSCMYCTAVKYIKLASGHNQFISKTCKTRNFHKHINRFHSNIRAPISYPYEMALT